MIRATSCFAVDAKRNGAGVAIVRSPCALFPWAQSNLLPNRTNWRRLIPQRNAEKGGLEIGQHPFTDRHQETSISGWGFSDLLFGAGIPDRADAHPVGDLVVLPGILRHQRGDAGNDHRRGLGLCAARPVSCRTVLQATWRFYALATAISIPASMMVQFSLITTLALNATTLVSWRLLLAAMTVPYVFAGIVVSLALTRSPFPVNQVYGVDLLGAALGCAAVVLLLNVLDGPTTLLLTGLTSAPGRNLFQRQCERRRTAAFGARAWWPRPCSVIFGFIGPRSGQRPYPGRLAARYWSRTSWSASA